jgi:hypothetical protein
MTGSVFASAADFHNMRFVSFFTVFAAVFTPLFRRTVARAMLTLVRCFVSHYFTSTNERDQFFGGWLYRRPLRMTGQASVSSG